MKVHGTTIVAVRHRGQVAVAGDGQVSVNDTIMKSHARKVQRLGEGKVIGGFAGGVADAMTLFDKFREKLEEARGNLRRAAVELAKEWRTDRFLRHLEAMLLVVDADTMLLISGQGDVIEPDDNVIAIGSGGGYALAAAKALVAHSDLSAPEIARTALEIAASICVYTNREITLEVLGREP
ncbi:MAG TPA: ATP-dependent protease subunit HslV [Armatimonadetes bacterium]|nr:ATP-dependent protease subunit HslV [Armatimonadota bacterium]